MAVCGSVARGSVGQAHYTFLPHNLLAASVCPINAFPFAKYVWRHKGIGKAVKLRELLCGLLR